MNAFLSWEASDLWQLAGWTMLHFLWLGTLVGVAAIVCRLVLRRAPANVRYAAALASFLALTALPIGIAGWLVVQSHANYLPVNSLYGGDDYEHLDAPQPAVPPVTEPVAVSDQAANQAAQLTAASQAAANTYVSASQLLPTIQSALASSAQYLPWLWLIGTPLTFVLLTSGIIGAERLRRASRVIDDGPIKAACRRLCESLHIGRQVTIAVCERIAAPVLVGIVRPIILLPPAALTGWSPDEIEMVLLHELAHVHRWDNLVNLAQRLVESLLFFHPAVWLVSSWVRREREACCDAVVVGRTARPHAYAEMLVALAAQMPRSVLFHPAATSAMAAGPLRGRIRHILGLEDDPMLISGKSLGVVMGSLLLAAALVALSLTSRTQAENSQPMAAAETEPKIHVPFVVGASHFKDGDTISITEVHGTAAAFEPGNVYSIKGTYSLRSRDQASLSAFVTWRDAGRGRTSIDKDQAMTVSRGNGEFTLKLPMSHDGWPHVSFYPADGGEGFGGIYFGTGDSVATDWAAIYGESEDTSREIQMRTQNGEQITAESQPGRLRLQVRTTTPSKFPSLEDQKLADTVYKKLGLELEPIGEADLERVKALGYDGGVFVANNNGAIVSWEAHGIMPNDILVGLHVWPTTNVADVINLLNRSDLVELNPLKFYVVRGGERGSTDTVVSGRFAGDIVAPTPPNQELPPTPVPTSLISSPTDPNAPNPDSPVAKQSSHAPTPSGDDEDLFGPPPGKPFPDDLFAASKTPSPAAEQAQQLDMRYEGKTFKEWQQAWRHELSTEKRLEAVQALAAFGASGNGKEAAETILRVVKQLDWSTMDDSSAGKLKAACVDAFTRGTATGGYHIPVNDWMPLVTREIAGGNKNLQLFAANVFGQLSPNPAAVAPLIDLSRNKDSLSTALIGLGAVDPQRDNDAVVTRLGEILKESQSSDTLIAVVNMLISRPTSAGGTFLPLPQLKFVPELEPLIFHSDPAVRRSVRYALQWIQPEAIPLILPQLVEVLDDKNRKADHIDALRAIAAIGPKAISALPTIESILAANDERAIPAALALRLVTVKQNMPWELYQFAYSQSGVTITRNAAHSNPEQLFELMGIENNEKKNELEGLLAEEYGQLFTTGAGSIGVNVGGGFF